MKNKLQKIFLIATLVSLTACLESGTSTDAVATQKQSTSIASLAVSAPAIVIPTDPINCDFNGSIVVDGSSVQAFQNSTVEFGASCVSENRLCTSGNFAGSYTFASCSVGAPASCLFNGATIVNGDSVTGYTSSTVAFGQVCSSVAESRTCNNGVLTGSATYASCEINAARSCLFDGKTILNGDSINAFQSSTSQFGGSCTKESRTCNDGTLSGSFAYGSCTIDQAAGCLFNGRTLAHGEVATAFLASTSAYGVACTTENRTCDNGQLSGSYAYDSCSENLPASCTFDNKTVPHNTSVIAFASDSVTYGNSCVSESRACVNGALSGSFTNSLCSVQAASNCTLNGQTVLHGESRTTYASATVPAGQTCQSEIRTCSNGVLSGSTVFESCVVDVVTTNPPPSCTFNGTVYPSDATIKGYQSATVPYGQVCKSETRQCLSGAFTGSFSNAACTVDAAANCALNGKTIAHGSSVTVFTSSSVASGQVCQTEVRSCNNGALSGSAVAETCVVQNPPPPPTPVDPGSGSGAGSCQPTAIIWEFPNECHGQCGKGNGYFKSRISRDNGKTWLTIMKNKLPDDLKEIWNYMIKQNGKNSCDRPNVNYVASKNKGYVVLDIKKIPDCKVCRFIEIEKEHNEREHHGSCHKNKGNEHKKVMKFICGEIKKKKHHEHEDHDDDDDHGDKDDHGHEHEDRD